MPLDDPAAYEKLVGLPDIAAVEAALKDLGVEVPAASSADPMMDDIKGDEQVQESPFEGKGFKEFAGIAADRAMGAKDEAQPRSTSSGTKSGEDEEE